MGLGVKEVLKVEVDKEVKEVIQVGMVDLVEVSAKVDQVIKEDKAVNLLDRFHPVDRIILIPVIIMLHQDR